LSFLHDKYGGASPNKASNNNVFVCENYYYGCLIKEQLGIIKQLVMLLTEKISVDRRILGTSHVTHVINKYSDQ
jgi:hypothetical protein